MNIKTEPADNSFFVEVPITDYHNQNAEYWPMEEGPSTSNHRIKQEIIEANEHGALDKLIKTEWDESTNANCGENPTDDSQKEYNFSMQNYSETCRAMDDQRSNIIEAGISSDKESQEHKTKKIDTPSMLPIKKEFTVSSIHNEFSNHQITIDRKDIKKEVENNQELSIPAIILPKLIYYRRNFVCGVCYLVCPSETTLAQHKEFHDKEFLLVQDHRQFSEKEFLLNNKEKKVLIVKKYVCDVCSYKCRRLTHLKTHKLIHTGERPYKCDVCDYRSTTSSQMKRHSFVHSGEKPFQCDICKYKFTSTSDLKKHSLIHTGEKPFACDQCSYKSRKSNQLKTHKLLHSGIKPFKCDLCEYECRSSTILKGHSLIHTGELPFSCEVCEFKSRLLTSMKTHKMIHSGERPYKCNLCDYKSRQSSDLRRHLMIHNGEKPHSCDVCQFRCRTRRHLREHKLTHSDVKLFNCEMCSFKSSTSSSLKRHRLLHNGEETHTCDICFYTCRTMSYLRTHKKGHKTKRIAGKDAKDMVDVVVPLLVLDVAPAVQ